MTKQEIVDILNELRITQREFAKYLSVDIRTVGRWINHPEKMPETAKQVLLAWVALNKVGEAWKPGDINIVEIGTEWKKK